MNDGLHTTWKTLANARNEAAVPVLLAALRSPEREIPHAAMRALLERRGQAPREVVRLWKDLDDDLRTLVVRHPDRLTGALRDAILSADPELCATACEIACLTGEYDLIPPLVTAAEDASNPNADTAAAAVTTLVEILYEELAAPRDYRRRRDPQLVRRHIVGCLQRSIERLQQHSRRELVEAFLMLANRENAALKQILQNPRDPSFRAVRATLTESERPGVMRLLLAWLDDPHAPPSALMVLAGRTDEAMLGHLLKKIGNEPSIAARRNLRRVKSIAWVDDPSLLDRFDEAGQHAAVQMAVASGARRQPVFELLKHLLSHGNVGGRRAAAEALSGFQGAAANQLALQALSDEDPQVQANLIVQLRSRGIPGALTRLLELLDSPHRTVRDAARECLAEFKLTRFLSAFDMLDDDVRQSTGALVRKVDPHALQSLAAEMRTEARSRRLRAVQAAVAMNSVADLETRVIGLLKDDDHFVRAEAARALAQCPSPAARQALREALLDSSVSVQEAAESTLVALADTTALNKATAGAPASTRGAAGAPNPPQTTETPT